MGEVREVFVNGVKLIEHVGGSQLGLLHYEAKISNAEFDAGSHFSNLWELRRRYYLDAPRQSAKVANLQSSHGHNNAEDDEDTLVFARRLQLRFQAAMDYLKKYDRPWELVREIQGVCVENKSPVCLDTLRKALSALADHFGLKSYR